MFEYYKGKIILKSEKIQCSSLKKFVEKLKAEKALAVAQYVFLVADRSDDNPIKNLKLSERLVEAEAVSKVFSVCDTQITSQLEILCEKYSLEMSDKLQNDIDVYDKKMFEYIDLLQTTTPIITKTEAEKSENVYFTSNMKIIADILNSTMDTMVDKSSIVGMKKGGKFIQSLRGGLSPNSRGKTTQMTD